MIKKIVVSGNFQPTICEPEIARNHFLAFWLCFGQILKKTPVPDNFQLTIYKLKLPGTSYILKGQPLPGNSMLTYSKLGIARNLLHFLEIVRNHFHF